MKLGRVIGNAVSTIKNEAYHSAKLMVVQPLGLDLQPTGKTHLGVDLVGAGAGDIVVVAEEGRGAREMLNNPRSPIRTTLIAIVDRVDLAPQERTEEPPQEGRAAEQPTGHGMRFWSR